MAQYGMWYARCTMAHSGVRHGTKSCPHGTFNGAFRGMHVSHRDATVPTFHGVSHGAALCHGTPYGSWQGAYDGYPMKHITE